MAKQNKVKLYLFYILASLSFVMAAALFQMAFIYKSFELKFLFVPVIVGLFFGVLLAVVSDLRQQLKYKSKLFSSLIDYSPDLTYIKNLDGSIEYISPSIESFSGYAPEAFYEDADMINKIIDPRDREAWDLCQKRRQSPKVNNLEIRIIRKDGSLLWMEHNHDTIIDEKNRVIGIRSTNHDITGRKDYEEKIQDLANYDSLTLLPNRRSLMLEIEKSLGDAKIYHSEFALMFVDLDRFKYINDTFGHSFGDLLLQHVSGRLNAVCQDKAFVSRFGGDEFVILFPKQSRKELLEVYASELLASLNRVYIINEITIYIDATIGVSRYPYDGNSAEVLIKNADIAMYKAKKTRHTQWFFFSAEFSKQSSDFFALERSLHDAFTNEQIILYYQPQFDIQTMEVTGAEALARWVQEDGSVISPDKFIPVAEESGLILQLGERVIALSVAFHKRLISQQRDLKISINISPFQLQVKEQYLDIIRLLKDRDITAENIEIEVTENLFFEQSSEQIENLKLFVNEGFTIAIDDFGTGFSSLSYLKNMPAHYLKIDKVFISNMLKSKADKAIVDSIITMAHNFNMKVIAEGIETAEELSLLQDLGCDYGQGYFYARPMPETAFQNFINDQKIQKRP